MGRDLRAVILVTMLALMGCGGPQSALDPAGPSAASLHRLGIIMYVGATLVTLLVTALMLVPFLRPRERPVNRNLFLWGGGVALPLLTLRRPRRSRSPSMSPAMSTGGMWPIEGPMAPRELPRRTSCTFLSASRSSCSSTPPT
jgi:cytochrome c oxidase subunit 2